MTKVLPLNSVSFYDEKIKEWVETKIKNYEYDDTELKEQVNSNKDEIDNLKTETGLLEQITEALSDDLADRINDLTDITEILGVSIGDLENLDTAAKSDLVSSINEIVSKVDEVSTDSEITIDTDNTTDGMAKSYTIAQGGIEIGVIDIPKDMVVSSGKIEVNPSGMAEGTYIVLTLANATNDTLYIDVGSLVDIYTVAKDAVQIQLSITAANEISATIVAGSVTTTELADNAVTTAKIADGNVTTDKLSTTIQSSLDKADSAVQSVITGTSNGTISVDGNDIVVKGLGSAAYTESIAYYGTCSTAASTATKIVTCSGFTLSTGARITVRFSYANTTSSPTLNVNSTGAKNIVGYGTTVSNCLNWDDNGIVEFVYDGTSWVNVSPNNGITCIASANYSHAEGYYTTASASYSHAEGFNTTASADCSHAEGSVTMADGNCSHAEGSVTMADGNCSHAEGSDTTAYGDYSHAEGSDTTAYGDYSHAEGSLTVANASFSHAEGRNTTASATCSHTEGFCTEAYGDYSHAEGSFTVADTTYSHTSGYCTQSGTICETVIGQSNTMSEISGSEYTTVGNAFVIGNGTSSNSRSNAFRVTKAGATYGLSAFNSSGADYAEFIKEWYDGNPDNEDRVGYFVTVKDGLLYKANEGDYIAGITSGNPSVVGNSDENYRKRFEHDEFNRFIYEDVEEETEKTDEDGNIVVDEETGKPVMVKTGNIIKNGQFKWNEDYDSSIPYVERKDRPEWDYVGMIGVLPVRDDGTCIPGEYCKCGSEGIATLATEYGFFTYYVIERISNSVISVIFK